MLCHGVRKILAPSAIVGNVGLGTSFTQALQCYHDLACLQAFSALEHRLPRLLVVPVLVLVNRHPCNCIAPTRSQSAISVLIFPITLTRSSNTDTARLGERERLEPVSGFPHVFHVLGGAIVRMYQ